MSTKSTPEEVRDTLLRMEEVSSSLPRKLSHSPFVRSRPRRLPGLLLAEDYGRRQKALTFPRRRSAETLQLLEPLLVSLLKKFNARRLKMSPLRKLKQKRPSEISSKRKIKTSKRNVLSVKPKPRTPSLLRRLKQRRPKTLLPLLARRDSDYAFILVHIFSYVIFLFKLNK